jgi:hypothetical protein
LFRNRGRFLRNNQGKVSRILTEATITYPFVSTGINMAITNEKLKNYTFLKEMYQDSYFPTVLVDQGKQILVNLCEKIESQKPKDEYELYVLTHLATEEFNRLAEKFDENDSEIETVARDCIGMDFSFIAEAYGFDADTEELIAPRDW